MFALLRTFLFGLFAPIGLLLILAFWPWWLMLLFVLIIAVTVVPPKR